MIRVMFVCLGNICRSPTAHGVFEAMVRARSLEKSIQIESSGTGGWHIGAAPDSRAQATAQGRGYDLSALRAQRFSPKDFDSCDYILAMDQQNLRDLQALCPADYPGHLALFLSFSGHPESEVPDPYYGGDDGFDHVLDLVESASKGLLDHIVSTKL